MKFVRTTFFSGVITFFRISSSFLANKFIAIYTGPSGIALIGAFTNFLSIIQTFANGAINTGVIKYTAEYEDSNEKLQSLFSTSLRVSLYCSGFVGLFLFFFSANFSNWIFSTNIYENPIKVLGISITLYSINSLFISILNGKKLIKTYTLVNSVGSIISLAITLILVFFFNFLGAIYALVLSQSLVFFVTFFLLSKHSWFCFDNFKHKIDYKILKKLSHYSLMTIISALTVPVSQIILREMLISSHGIQSAGIWQGMMRISDGYLMILTTALATYYLPKLASLNTDEDLRTEILLGYKIFLPIVIFSSLVIYFLRFFIVKTLYTPDFFGMSELFLYQLIGDFLKISAWILGYLIVAKSMTKTYIITEIGSALLYVLLGYFFVYHFGLKGISMAFAVNYLLYLLAILYIFRKLIVSK